MPDITMCPGTACPLRNGCYRYRAIAVGRQDWFGSAPYSAADGRCDDLLDVKRYEATEDRIRGRAYAIWEADGRPEGRAEADWYRARRELEQDVLRPADPT